MKVPPTSTPRIATGATLRGPSTIARVKLLLVSLYFPPAGGGGVQRPLKFAQYLPALGIETHVLAPDDPKWIHDDADLRVPTQAWVHRARYLGPKGRKPAEELHGKEGLERALVHARLASRRLLVPDENVSWNLTAIPAAIRIARQEKIDVVITTSPPNSVHLVGAAVKRATGREVGRRPARLARRAPAPARREPGRAGEGEGRRGRRAARRPARPTRSPASRTRSRTRRAGFEPRGRVVTISNGCDFDDFAGLDYTPGERFRITHTGSFFGKRDPRPFLTALDESGLDVVARFLGDFRSSDREWAERARARRPAGADPVRAAPAALELQRDSEALLLLIPDAGGRGKGVLSGKVFEYLAAERPILAAVPPDGAAAELIRETGAGVVAPPDDVEALKDALAELHDRFANGGLPGDRDPRGDAPPALAPRARRGARGARCARCDERQARPGRRRALLRDPVHGHVREAPVGGRAARSASRTCSPRSSCRLRGHPARHRRPAARLRRGCRAALFFLAFLLVYLIGFFNLDTDQALAQWAKGMVKFLLHFLFLVAGIAYLVRRSERFYWTTLAVFMARLRRERGLRDRPARRRRGAGDQPRPVACSRRSPAARARSTSTARSRARACTGRTRSPATRTTSGSS